MITLELTEEEARELHAQLRMKVSASNKLISDVTMKLIRKMLEAGI